MKTCRDINAETVKNTQNENMTRHSTHYTLILFRIKINRKESPWWIKRNKMKTWQDIDHGITEKTTIHSVYSNGTKWQVDAGFLPLWRICTGSVSQTTWTCNQVPGSIFQTMMTLLLPQGAFGKIWIHMTTLQWPVFNTFALILGSFTYVFFSNNSIDWRICKALNPNLE